jgi:hypothetical protein
MRHAPGYAKNLRAVHNFCSTVGYIEKVIDTLAANKSNLVTFDTGSERGSVIDMIHSLSDRVKRDLLTKCINTEYNLFLKYLTEFYGKDYVQRGARMVFNFSDDALSAKEPLIKYIKGDKVKLS